MLNYQHLVINVLNIITNIFPIFAHDKIHDRVWNRQL